MKPIFLEMKNIGPFVKRTMVDLSKIEEGGLFLVSGPTGSGKSFIFDTMCYALYGKTPSGREGNLASDHSGIGDEPIIRFSFCVGDAEYLIERTLDFKDHSKRGGGIVDRTEKAALYRIIGNGSENGKKKTIASRKSDVHAACVDILGLDMEQFSRVMMIPQGEFRELLKAETKDREVLLRKLFDSSLFWDISNELSRRYGILSDELKDSRSRNDTRIETIVNKLGLDSGPGEGLTFDEWSERSMEDRKRALSIMESNEKDAERKLNEVHKILEISKEAFNTSMNLDQTERRIEELRVMEKDEIKPIEYNLELSSRAGHLREDLGRLDELSKNILQMRGELKEKEEILRDKKNHLEIVKGERDEKKPGVEREMDSIKEQLSILKKARPGVEKMEDLRNRIKPLEKEVSRLREEHEAIITEIGDLEEEEKTILVEIKKVPIETEMVKKTAIIRKNGGDLLLIMKRIREREIDFERATLKMSEMEKMVDRKESELKEIRKRREETIAGELASSLKEGLQCPVCGSMEHPHPRKSSQKDVSREMVIEAEVSLEGIRKKYSDIVRETTIIGTEVEELKKRSDEIRTENGELDLSLDDLIIKVNELKEKEKEMEGFQKRRGDLEKRKNDIDKRLKDLHGQESDKRRSMDLKASDLRVMKNSFDEKIEELRQISIDVKDPLGSLDRRSGDLMRKKEDISTWLERIEKLMDEAMKSFTRAEQDRISCSERLVEYMKNEEEERGKLIERVRSIEGIGSIDDLRKAILNEEEERRFRDKLDRFRNEISELKGRADEFRRKLSSLKIDTPDEEALKDLESSEKTLTAEWKAIHGGMVNMQEDLKWAKNEMDMIRRSRKEMAAKEEEIAIVGRLSHQVKGNGFPRISLERFFLSQRFEEVLISSNQRLKVLSGGRFMMKRAEAHGKKSKGGLDLNVYDNYTGQERPARTLSGGQMFLSSLALALGLADVVQSRSGGIRMDALFIDEGFGSLDEETLQTALKVLSELRHGKMVGVISHVGELKRQIRTGFEVVPSPEGSTVRTVC